jgi:hypothetical protein
MNTCGEADNEKADEHTLLAFFPVTAAPEQVAVISVTGIPVGHPAPERLAEVAWTVAFQVFEVPALPTFAVTVTGLDAVTTPPGLFSVKVIVEGVTVKLLMVGL